jgi:hypothetical protein
MDFDGGKDFPDFTGREPRNQVHNDGYPGHEEEFLSDRGIGKMLAHLLVIVGLQTLFVRSVSQVGVASPTAVKVTFLPEQEQIIPFVDESRESEISNAFKSVFNVVSLNQ